MRLIRRRMAPRMARDPTDGAADGSRSDGWRRGWLEIRRMAPRMARDPTDGAADGSRSDGWRRGWLEIRRMAPRMARDPTDGAADGCHIRKRTACPVRGAVTVVVYPSIPHAWPFPSDSLLQATNRPRCLSCLCLFSNFLHDLIRVR